jgi:hypothetical protein
LSLSNDWNNCVIIITIGKLNQKEGHNRAEMFSGYVSVSVVMFCWVLFFLFFILPPHKCWGREWEWFCLFVWTTSRLLMLPYTIGMYVSVDPVQPFSLFPSFGILTALQHMWCRNRLCDSYSYSYLTPFILSTQKRESARDLLALPPTKRQKHTRE